VQDISNWLRARGVLVKDEILIDSDRRWRVDSWVRSEGVVYWLDVLVTDPAHATALSKGSAVVPGVAARLAESQKHSKWRRKAEAHNAVPVALAFETSGRFGDEAEQFLKQMEKASQPGPSLNDLWLQISVTLARANVALIRESVRKAGLPHQELWGRRVFPRPYAA
jgi:hypothetical protein